MVEKDSMFLKKLQNVFKELIVLYLRPKRPLAIRAEKIFLFKKEKKK
jgi:hypothetical protein